MKILLYSYCGYGAWFLTRFMSEGHKCDYYLEDKKYAGVLNGIIPTPLSTKPDFKIYDLIIFDLTGRPKVAEQAKLEAPTLGDGNLASTLEEERLFGIQIMEEVGITVPFYEAFNDIGDAKRFIKKTNKRYVFKPDGGQEADVISTYVSKDANDLLKYLDKLGGNAKGAEFILQEVVDGTEISTEGYFDGHEFFLINATLEEKKFMNDNKGGNTGCAGNLVWTYAEPPYLFKEGLGRMKEWLQGVGFMGMIDLNTICSATKAYGLEWTPRFGYDASATLTTLVKSDLGEFMQGIASGNGFDPRIEGPFAAGVRLTIPPYPTEADGYYMEEVPIEGIEPDDLHNCYMYDACLDGDSLVTAGMSGFIAVPMAVGGTPEEAWGRVYEKVKHIQIPNVQYRTDLPATTKKRYEILRNQGWFR